MYTQLIQTFSPHIPHVPSLSAPVRRAHWEKYWTGDRPPILNGASEVMSRWTLFNLGTHIDGPESALNFYAGVSMWAAGNAPRSVYRACKPLATEDFAERLFEAITHTRECEPEDAYWAWSTDVRIPFVGPSHFTKLMYFSRRNPLYESENMPLILDGRIARALKMKQRSAWTASTYGTYLRTLAEIAHEWGPGATAEDVECQLTAQGIRAITRKTQLAQAA